MRVVVDYSDESGLFAGTLTKRVWILCDKCGKPIDADHPGMAISRAGVDLPATSDVNFFHKVTCDDDRQAGWTDVDGFLALAAKSLEHAAPQTDESSSR